MIGFKECLFFTTTSCLLFAPAFCDDITFINANSTRYADNNVCCSGDVIIIYCKHIISADEISYDRKKEIVKANGNVIIKDERLNVYFADSLCVSKDFSSGNAENLKIIMPDKSRFAAQKCEIRDGKFELENAIFSPCYECSKSGELTWQVKSLHVTFDPEDCAEYENAGFELFGTPVLYTPYLYHVSPKIKRKSGFLVPKFSTSSKSGFSILPQYLYSISDSQELILKPILTSKIGNVGWAYYGLRFPNGEFNVDASITGTKSVSDKVGKDDLEEKALKKMRDSGYRGHIFSKMRYEINDTWRCSSDIKLTSDNYYLKRFPFFPAMDRVLESNAKLEGFDGGNYTSLKTAMFQSDHRESVTRILPSMERSYSYNLFAGTFHWDSMFMNLDFNNHRSAQKVVSNVYWDKKILLPYGNIFNIKGTISLKGLRVSENQKTDYNSSCCAVPQIHASWQWPLMVLSSNDWLNTIFTPLVGTVISSDKRFKDIFEDQFCEINNMNVFEDNRSISTYNVDSGKRVYYGAKLAGYKNGENLYQFTVGRSVELTTPPERSEVTGLKHKHSNIITALDVFLSNKFSFICNGSYSTRRKKWLKIESGLRFLDKKLDLDILTFRGKQYLVNPFTADAASVDPLTEDEKIQKYKGVVLDISYHATNTITLMGGIVIGNEFKNTININEKASSGYKLIRHNVGIGYKNECTEANFMIERRNYSGGDLKPETVFTFVVHLKNLGI